MICSMSHTVIMHNFRFFFFKKPKHGTFFSAELNVTFIDIYCIRCVRHGTLYCTLYGMVLVLYMNTGGKITLLYAVLPEDEDGVDTGVAAFAILLL